MSIDQLIMAPVREGQALGSVQVKLRDEVVSTQPLVSLQTITEGSFWQRISDEALLYLE
jgi:D-alanyl-D-alanine carboxypeptidase (penicillin-binding protein 5/6)